MAQAGTQPSRQLTLKEASLLLTAALSYPKPADVKTLQLGRSDGGFEGGGRREEGLFHSLRVIALYSHRICCSGSKHEQHLPEIHYKCVSG